MRFAIDAHAIGQHLTGNEVYVRNLIEEFAQIDRSSEFLAYVSSPEAGSSLPSRILSRQVSKNPFIRLGYDLNRRVREDRASLLHVQYTAPVSCPVPIVASVHDISFLEHPEYFPKLRSMQLRYTVKRTIYRAAKVICPSEFSRKSLLRAYPVDPSKVAVAPIAVSSDFRPLPHEPARVAVRERFGVPAPYILTVGDLQPRKNPLGMLNAFQDLLSAAPLLPHHLVFVGKETWFGARVRKAAAESAVANRIHFTGFVTDKELLQLYNGSELFVFPSFYEGFGMPILEAMACGRAVACSNTTAMPEVANAAALLFDPHSTREITLAMRDLLLNSELRTRMERLGQQRANYFSWRRNAERTLELYYEVTGKPKRTAARTRTAQPVTRP